MAIQRIKVLGIPVDICKEQNMEMEILELLAKPGTKQIIFLDIWGLLKARVNKDFLQCLTTADLVLPVSKSILKGAAFLKKAPPVRYNPFHAVVSILSILESHYKSLFLLGGRKKALMTAEKNVRTTFKTLSVIGRYVGYYPKNEESNIIQAIYKASPSLVLVSDGIKEKDSWSYNRREKFSSSIFLYYKDAINIFSGRKNRVADKTFNRGLEIWPQIFRNPLKLFLVFPYIWYCLSLLWYRMFKKD